MAGEMEAGVVAMPVWQDPLVVAIPARHPLLAHKRVPLEEVVGYPLVLCHPQVCAECSRQRSAEHTSALQSLLRTSYAVFCLQKKQITLQNLRHYCDSTTSPSRHK